MSESPSTQAARQVPVSGAPAVDVDCAEPVDQRMVRYARNSGAALVRAALLFITLVVVMLSIGPVTGRYRTLTVLSGSMRPWMKPGDIVIDTPMRASDLREGDIVTYHLPGGNRTLVTHRIVRIVQPGDLPTIQTKGDANNTPDPIAKLDEPRVWRGRMVVPKVGYALNALRSPKMRLLGSVLAPILLLGVWLLRIWGRRPEEAQAGEPEFEESADADRESVVSS
ncbi:MAG: signal peptidase I [Pseudonocardiales bacterium]